MSNDATEAYLSDRLIDGLTKAADRADGLGNGNRPSSDALLHAEFIAGLRQAENAARGIAHARGIKGQGIAWVRLATKLGAMLEASTGAAALSIANAADSHERAPRGQLWVRLGLMLKVLASDARKSVDRRSDRALVMGGTEYLN